MMLPADVTSQATYYPDALAVGPVVVAAQAVLRLDPDGIYVHCNSTHTTIGITDASISATGEIVLTHAQVGPCAGLFVSPDETLAGERGVTAGGSGGGSETRIRVHHPSIPGRRLYLHKPEEYALVASPYANLWVIVLQMVRPSTVQ